MVYRMKLPARGIETTAVVGPFFWCSHDDDEEDPHLHIIHRKSDVRKKGKTRGWEMMLSYSFTTRITTGFLKGTPSADLENTISHLKQCAHQIGHPLLLPIIIFSHDLSPVSDVKQRDARDWLRRLENAVSLRNEVEEHEQYFQDGLIEVDSLNRDLVECHGHVLWKRPQAYLAIAKEMDNSLEKFWGKWLLQDEANALDQRKALRKLHRTMHSRVDFYKVKLTGMENYIHITLERLKVQREAVSFYDGRDMKSAYTSQLYNIMSQREARLNLEIAGEQRRIAHASKRDSTAMKTLSLMGALFLPGTYLASVFSMTFFNFQPGSSPVVSVELWIYFAVTVPITFLIVGAWMWMDRRRIEQAKRDDADLEKNIEKMENDIMFHLRKRTMSKTHTWNTLNRAQPLSPT